MKEIKVKIINWLLLKIIKYGNIEPLDFYRLFSKQIEIKRSNESKEYFSKFKSIQNYPKRRISDDIHNIDSGGFLESTVRYNIIKK